MTVAIRAFFDEPTNSLTYVVHDPETREAAIIDPLLDFDAASGRIGTASAEAVLDHIAAHDLMPVWILETHAHADHLSAAAWLKARTGARIGIGAGIRAVQAIFRPRFGHHRDAADVRFDLLLEDGASLPLGRLSIDVMATPGHTPACVAYRIADTVFVGDTLFMPDYGTARADFPGGDARMLYRSIRRILDLPATTAIYLCHDYKAPGRDHFAWETTVAEQRRANIHVHDGVDEEAFVALRTRRDATLPPPRLLLPSLQVNIEAGRLPEPAADGMRRLVLPLRVPEDYGEA